MGSEMCIRDRLGGHLMGPDASTLVQPLIQMLSFGQRVEEVTRGQYWIHPALSEVVVQLLAALTATALVIGPWRWHRSPPLAAWVGVWLLLAVSIAMLAITAFGIGGLASFWVQQRTRQIGVRRALGATRGQILRYFQTENFLLASIGIAIGMLLAFAINQLLMGKYEMARLPLFYLPAGAVLLWLLGQLAVYAPARRAASIPPATATRSV